MSPPVAPAVTRLATPDGPERLSDLPLRPSMPTVAAAAPPTRPANTFRLDGPNSCCATGSPFTLVSALEIDPIANRVALFMFILPFLLN